MSEQEYDKSTGLGDTIAKVMEVLKMDKVAQKMAEMAGKKDCGCKKRQKTLNELFPYTPEQKNDQA